MSRTVLIVDDEAGAREVLQRILELADYDIVQAESGSQAIALATTLQVDAFLLDIDMPGMNGMDLCRALRSMETYATSPIIFLTGATDDAVLEAAFESGGDDFIQKPFTSAGVRARLKNHLQRMEYRQRFERMRRVLKQYLSKRTLEVVEDASMTGELPPPHELDRHRQAVAVLQHVAERAVQHAGFAVAERCRVSAGIAPSAAGFDADELDVFVRDERVEHAGRVGTAADARDD